MKINDIYSDCRPDVSLQRKDSRKDVLIEKEKAINTKDIRKIKKTVDISGQKHIKIFKNNDHDFDCLRKKQELYDINLKKNHRVLINDSVIVEVERSGKRKGEKKNKTKKNFIRKIEIKRQKLKNNYLFSFRIFLRNFYNGIRLKFFRNIGYIILSLLAVLFLDKLLVEKLIEDGYAKLLSAKNNITNVEQAKMDLNDAKFKFIVGDFLFKPFLLLPFDNINNAYHIISGAKELSILGDNLLHITSEMDTYVKMRGIENIWATNVLENLKLDFLETQKSMEMSLYHYNQVNDIGDEALNKRFFGLREKLRQSRDYIKDINDNYDYLLSSLGHYEEKRYLVVFQNNDEIRPTGGFMGSMGVISLFKGKVKDFVKKDVYSYEWDLKKVDYNKELAPEGLNQITEYFGLRDSNYFLDIKKSSENIKFFVKMTGEEIDGIVFVNQNTILDILDDLSGIKIDLVEEVVTSKNFSEIISLLVEAKVSKEGTLGTPKEVLFSFIDTFNSKLKSKAEYSRYLGILYENFNNRELFIHSFNFSENELLKNLGLGGNIDYSNSLDFTYPVFTSIGGNKSDRYVSRKFKKVVQNNIDCSIDTSFSIIQKHEFTLQVEDNLRTMMNDYGISKNDTLINIQGAGDNYQFIRLVIPKNAIVEPQEGLTVKLNENNKILEFYIKTMRLETTTNTIKYALENKDCRNYDYTMFKQPGLRPYDMDLEINSEKIESSGIKSDFYYSMEK